MRSVLAAILLTLAAVARFPTASAAAKDARRTPISAETAVAARDFLAAVRDSMDPQGPYAPTRETLDRMTVALDPDDETHRAALTAYLDGWHGDDLHSTQDLRDALARVKSMPPERLAALWADASNTRTALVPGAGARRVGSQSVRSAIRRLFGEAPADGWSIPAALRAVALADPKRALPKGVSAQAFARLPETSPLWKLAAENLKGNGSYNNGASDEKGRYGWDPSVFARKALDPILLKPNRRLLAAGAKGRKAEAVAAPSVDPRALVSQFRNQYNKTRGRELNGPDGYNADLSANGKTRPAWLHSLPRARSLAPLLAAKQPVKALIDELRRRFGWVHWADVGAGVGRASRQWSSLGLGPDVRRTIVDLFDWEKAAPGYYGRHVSDEEDAMQKRHRPNVKLADSEGVRFARGDRPNLITSISSIIYWPDKLRGIANLYNQLADDGILAVQADVWDREMIQPFGKNRSRNVLAEFVSAIAEAGVEVTALAFKGSENLTLLAIRKLPGTRLVIDAPFAGYKEVSHGWGNSAYHPGDRAIARVVRR